MESLNSLIKNHRHGWGLSQEFFTQQDIYKADIDHIWKKQWIFAGFTTEIPKSGDYFVYNLLQESVIIIRGKNDDVYAHYNTCRHRGSILCTEERGHTHTLTCPYHYWVYEKNGNLKAARLMPEGFDKSQFGLHSLNIEVIEGLIFICFAEFAPDFNQFYNDFQPFLQPFQFQEAQVAHRDHYKLSGNWKLFVQNFRECYHCGPAHPEYCDAVVGANFMEDEERFVYWEKSKKDWIKKGLAVETIDLNMESSHFGIRYPLREGVESYSLDGKPVSSVMGNLTDYDNGVVGLVKLPNFWFDCVSDYAWAMRITPIDATHCDVDITFLVDKNAVEGKDYELEKLTAFWKITGGQDWELIKNNQKGIESSRYRPGPYSVAEEDVSTFDKWYITQLMKNIDNA